MSLKGLRRALRHADRVLAATPERARARGSSALCPVGTEVQSLVFTRPKFDAARAKAWALEHGFAATRPDTTPHTIRLRQQPPKRFRSGYFRFISFAPGVRAVIGCPR